MNKKFLIIIVIIVVVGSASYLWFYRTSQKPASTSSPSAETETEYVNNQYGFSFTLPEDWKGYTVVTSTWEGDTIGAQGEIPSEHGPLISLRNPHWSTQDPHQDIPIMIFTRAQWNSLQNDQFHIGAAPVNPTELGHNALYVFALPARYNFTFPTGWEEVQQIIGGNPLNTF